MAAALLPHVQDRRIFAYAGHFNWDTILDIMRALDPKRKILDNFLDGDGPKEIEPRPKAEKLLQELGRSGWTSLVDSIAANVAANVKDS